MALIAVAALGLAAPAGPAESDEAAAAQSPSWTTRQSTQVVNPSDQKGGTLKIGHRRAWGDSFDPGDTYYGYSWDLPATTRAR